MKRIKGIEDDAVIVVGIGVAGFFLLRNILPDFSATPAEKQAIQNQETLDPSDNVFSYQSQWFLNWETDNLDLKTFDTDTQYFNWLRDQYFANNSAPTPNMGALGNVVGWAESLYNDMTGFLFPNNSADAIYILNQITNKWQVGAISAYLVDNYGFGRDLWSLLHIGAGFTIKGVSSTDLVAAINRLNTLPD